jgi:hypothetical protein
MFSSLLRRSAAMALGVTAVATLTAGVAVSSGPHTTSISIRTVHQTVAPGASDTITGDLRVGGGQALPGKTVTLEAKLAADAAFLPVGSTISGSHGGVSLKVTPAETTRYRWVFAGDPADHASRSGIATVKVQIPTHPATRLPSSLSIRAATPVVNAAGNDAISGRLFSRRTPLRDEIVVLLSHPAGSSTWAFVSAKSTGNAGGVAFAVHPAATAYYKLVFQGTPKFRAARSAVVRITTRATALSIAVAPAVVVPGGSATVSGVLTNTAAPYAGQAVQLWGKPLNSKQNFAALASSTTAADGTVSFAVTPAKSMRYYLFFPHTTNAAAARSQTRTIVVS